MMMMMIEGMELIPYPIGDSVIMASPLPDGYKRLLRASFKDIEKSCEEYRNIEGEERKRKKRRKRNSHRAPSLIRSYLFSVVVSFELCICDFISQTVSLGSTCFCDCDDSILIHIHT